MAWMITNPAEAIAARTAISLVIRQLHHLCRLRPNLQWIPLPLPRRTTATATSVSRLLPLPCNPRCQGRMPSRQCSLRNSLISVMSPTLCLSCSRRMTHLRIRHNQCPRWRTAIFGRMVLESRIRSHLTNELRCPVPRQQRPVRMA